MLSPESTRLSKPTKGQPCNRCGWCCEQEPCALAQEFLNSTTGPCVALEWANGQATCGLVRNPLGYLYQASHPQEAVPVLEEAPALQASADLSVRFATALGLGAGCDADDP